LEWAERITLGFLVVVILAIVYVIWSSATRPLPSSAEMTRVVQTPPEFTVTPNSTPQISSLLDLFALPAPPPPIATSTPPGPRQLRIGIVAGHYRNDSGALCPSGLREVDINLAVAERVTARLKRRGYAVDLLGEFDEKLQDYQADVFVSLHSDSCETPRTGFKVARSEDSRIPETEDRLVECLHTAYETATGLVFDANTISDDMRGYHAFRKIDYHTPAAIVELGFMSDDLNLLLFRQDRIAAGLVDGIQCFLSGGPFPTATPSPSPTP
jgi:N-acetylmuramoyl-L-alanine amidase